MKYFTREHPSFHHLLGMPSIYNARFWGILWLACGLVIPRGMAGTVSTCERYQAVTVGKYIVQTDYWNQEKCPGTQCMDIDDQTGSFTVTQGDHDCGYSIASYPSVVFGSAWGQSSPTTELPAPLNSLKCVMTSWSFEPTNTGAWDAAYDIWLCQDHSCGSDGFPKGAEVMIWLDYRDTHGWQYDQGPATIDGMGWEVWKWDVPEGNGTRKYVAYLAKDRTDSIENLDIKQFLDDSQKRGYIQPSWWLYAVEAGNEMNKGGVPFTSKSFSVSVNKNYGAKPVLKPLPTWTPTATPNPTPDEIPPPP